MLINNLTNKNVPRNPHIKNNVINLNSFADKKLDSIDSMCSDMFYSPKNNTNTGLKILNFCSTKTNSYEKDTFKYLCNSFNKIRISEVGSFNISIKNEKFILPSLTDRSAKCKKSTSEYLDRSMTNKLTEFKNKNTINYRSGKKYLLKSDESVYMKNRKLKAKINESIKKFSCSNEIEIKDDHSNKHNLVKKRVEELLNPNTNLKLNSKPVNIYQSRQMNKEKQYTLNSPIKGMNDLKRRIMLKMEDPYLFLNRDYARESAVDQTSVLLNLFDENIKKIPASFD
jgi:hypothetical protein